MTAFEDFAYELEVIFFHHGFSIEGAKIAVKTVVSQRSVVRHREGRRAKRQPHLPISILVLVTPPLHYFQEAFVFLRHADQIVAGSRLKEVVSDFSFLYISFFDLEMVWAGHDFAFYSVMM